PDHAVLPAPRAPRGAAAADEVVHPVRQAAQALEQRGRRLRPRPERGDPGAAPLASDGHTAQASPSIGVLRMNTRENGRPRAYLRLGARVSPVSGDELGGWTARADDVNGVGSSSPYVYPSLDELFFALGNLCVSGSSARQPRQHAH